MTKALMTRIIREKRMIVIPLAVALAVNVALAVALVVPLARRVANAESREGQAVSALRAAAQERNAAQTMRDRKARAEQDLGRFYTQVLPSDLSAARRQTYVRLARLASDADLQPQRRTEELQPPKVVGTAPGPVLTRLEITMVLRGEYDNVRQFIRDVETSAEFVTIDHVSLAEGPEPDSPLVLTLVLATYFRAGGP